MINQENLYRFHLTVQLSLLEQMVITALMDYILIQDMFEYTNIFQDHGVKWDQILTAKLQVIIQDFLYRFYQTESIHLLRLEQYIITALMDYIYLKDMFEYINIFLLPCRGLK
ncbi:MAG: hypothetical protein EBT09_11645 [Actinobacteria bacterium]|nr:hypothetical protein [Actinomycetota bacterium]